MLLIYMYRKYDEKDTVAELYKKMHSCQTYQKKCNFSAKIKYDKPYYINNVFDKLNLVIDSSDPDAEFPQIYHGYQTAESIRNNYFENNTLKSIPIKTLFNQQEWDLLPQKYKNIYNTNIHELYNITDWNWLILVGLIHDVGKILVLEEFGSYPEWFSVGDIYPLACKFHSSNIYYNKEFYKLSPDFSNKEFQTPLGIYSTNCGFNNIHMTFSHDFYLANVLDKSNTNLPPEAIYIIRYHSFYSWHTPFNNIRGYTYLASENDWYYLPLLKLFQKSDLYSKTSTMPNIESIKTYYDNLINLYIPYKLYF